MIDFAIAIETCRPGAAYRLNHSVPDGTQEIVEWRGPGEQPTPQELGVAWESVKHTVVPIDELLEQD